METQEMISLALNARLGHWPPHLGLNTDAERIEYLATQLDEAATQIVNGETLEDENAALREERDDFKSKYLDAQGKLDQIRNIVDVQNK